MRSRERGGENANTQLTPSQTEVLRFIEDRCRQDGRPPSYREIQEHFGYKSVGTVQDHVKALQRKGHLTVSKGRSRGLRPAGFTHPNLKKLPLYGEVAAGSPRDSTQLDMGDLWVVDPPGHESTFALRVVGNSMIEAGIFEGDMLIVEADVSVRSGDVVVALVDGETTVKRYVEAKDEVFLVPANSALQPISLRGRTWTIQGKVVALHRRFPY